MIVGDEHDLRAKLGAALGEFTPGALPYDAVVRRGRAVVIRRRATIAATAVIVAAAAVAAPVLMHRLGAGSSPPMAPSHRRVTEYPPGPGAPRGQIAHGAFDGHRWSIAGSYARASGLCISWFAEIDCGSGAGPVGSSGPGEPLSPVMGLGSSYPVGQVWTVRRDVAYLRVSLVSGQVLRLRPASIFGPRYASYVAVVVPHSSMVRAIAAYSAHGELGYAVPFTADGEITVSRWLAPGQQALPEPASYRFGRVTVHVGPWGLCVVGPESSSTCAQIAGGTLPGGRQAYMVIDASGAGSSFLVVALAPAATYVIVLLAHGRTVRLRPVSVAGARFCVFRTPSGHPVYGWAAYSAAGRRLASVNGLGP